MFNKAVSKIKQLEKEFKLNLMFMDSDASIGYVSEVQNRTNEITLKMFHPMEETRIVPVSKMKSDYQSTGQNATIILG